MRHHSGKGGRRARVTLVSAFTLASGLVLASGGTAAAADGYGRCPDGRACYFVDSNGDGDFNYPTSCGNFHLRAYAGKISSVRTHGNPVQLRDVNQNPIGYVGPWTATNLSLSENDKAHWFEVIC
ncbi:peptidase inhibitor family I36 protein [Streptomyces ambofaciens]|uniref:peptidase inhibitor family I36 protein n=1 Tax=Streptomyces ambofaciens TaxID=1889 RepID=UPI000ABE9420|nr:hypothetical protein [Streptomyces ambofaciens]